MKRKRYTVLIIAAAMLLSSCGAPKTAPADDTVAAVTTAAETVPVSTAAEQTTTAATTTAATTTTAAETTQSPAEKARSLSKEFTEEFRGFKMTEVKQAIIEQNCALESNVFMYTDDGESLDHIYNAPSTYDITEIIFNEDGTVELYGVKNRIIPDKAKEIINDGIIQGIKDKISDIVSGRNKSEE